MGEDQGAINSRDTTLNMQQFLQTFGGEKVNTHPIFDRSGKGNDKLRVHFEINDQESAKALYDMVGVNKQNMLPGTDQKMQIYFLLSEQKFEEYADVAAQKYWEEQKQVEEDRKAKAAADRQNREQRQQNNRGQGDRRKGGNRRQ